MVTKPVKNIVPKFAKKNHKRGISALHLLSHRIPHITEHLDVKCVFLLDCPLLVIYHVTNGYKCFASPNFCHVSNCQVVAC